MVITIYRSASQRSRATRISRRARAQECIGAHGGRKAKLPPRSKKSQNFARGGLAKGLGHAFRGMQVVGIFTNRIGSKTNCPLGNAIFAIAILAITQSEDLKMRIRKWIFRLPASIKRPRSPRIRMQGSRLVGGDGERIASGLTLVRGLRTQVAEGSDAYHCLRKGARNSAALSREMRLRAPGPPGSHPNLGSRRPKTVIRNPQDYYPVPPS